MFENNSDVVPTAPEVSAFLRTPEQWTTHKEKRNRTQLQKNFAAFSPLFHAFYAGESHKERTKAREAMADALINEYESGISRRFAEIIDEQSDARIKAALEHMQFDEAQMRTIRTVKLLDGGKFPTVVKLLAYIGHSITKSKMQGYKEAKRLAKYVSLMSSVTTENDETGESKEKVDDNTFGKCVGVNPAGRSVLPKEPVDYERQALLAKQTISTARFLEAYRDSQLDIEATAQVLSVTKSAAEKRLERLRKDLRRSELEIHLRRQFNAPRPIAKAMATDMLPMIEILCQRTKMNFPTSWAAALELKRVNKTRRRKDDKPKSQWLSAVRCLYPLWCLERGY